MSVVKTVKLSNWKASSGNSYCSAGVYRFSFLVGKSLDLSLSTTEKSLDPCSLHWLQLFIYIDQMHSELNGPSSVSLPSGEMVKILNHLCGPSMDSLQYFLMSLVLRSPELHRVLQGQPHQHWVKGKYSYQGPSRGLKNKRWIPNTIPNNSDFIHLVCFLKVLDKLPFEVFLYITYFTFENKNDFIPVFLQLLESTKGDDWPSLMAIITEIVWEITLDKQEWINKRVLS